MVFMFVFVITLEYKQERVPLFCSHWHAKHCFKSADLGNLRYILIHSSRYFYSRMVSAKCLLQG